MGVKKATFQSGDQISQHLLPGGYSRLDLVRGTGGLVSASNVVLMGDCRAGEPNKVLWFGGPTEAVQVLRSGPLLDAVRHAFRPGGNLVPQLIGVIRVNPGTRATLALVKGATTQITVTAWDWGLHTNQLKMKVEAGTSAGKKLTLQFQTQEAFVADNVARNSFEILYTGLGSVATMTITKTGLTTSCTGAASDDLSITFASFPTIEDLVNYINDHASYTCTLKTGVPSQKTTELDSVTAQDIKGAAYIAASTLQAIIDTLNNCPWVSTAVFNSGASTRDIIDNSAFTYFSGAVDGAYTSSEWATSLTYAKEQDIQFLGTSSEDASIHALLSAHVAECNAVTGKAERQFIVGGAAGETVDQARTRAGNLASEYGMLAYPGFTHYDYDDTSKTKTWSPAYYAAKLLGAQAALAIAEPATNKDVDVLNWEASLSRTNLELLIAAGVCAGYKNRAGRFVTARTVTTYQGDEMQKCEFSMMREALYIARDLRTALEESFVGHALNNTQLGKIDGVVIGKLSQYYELGLFNGVPPYWGYKKTILGDQVKVEYDCNLTPPTNFLFITSHMHVYADVAAAA